jgi:hypothetical protein
MLETSKRENAHQGPVSVLYAVQASHNATYSLLLSSNFFFIVTPLLVSKLAESLPGRHPFVRLSFAGVSMDTTHTGSAVWSHNSERRGKGIRQHVPYVDVCYGREYEITKNENGEKS